MRIQLEGKRSQPSFGKHGRRNCSKDEMEAKLLNGLSSRYPYHGKEGKWKRLTNVNEEKKGFVNLDNEGIKKGGNMGATNDFLNARLLK